MARRFAASRNRKPSTRRRRQPTFVTWHLDQIIAAGLLPDPTESNDDDEDDFYPFYDPNDTIVPDMRESYAKQMLYLPRVEELLDSKQQDVEWTSGVKFGEVNQKLKLDLGRLFYKEGRF